MGFTKSIKRAGHSLVTINSDKADSNRSRSPTTSKGLWAAELRWTGISIGVKSSKVRRALLIDFSLQSISQRKSEGHLISQGHKGYFVIVQGRMYSGPHHDGCSYKIFLRKGVLTEDASVPLKNCFF